MSAKAAANALQVLSPVIGRYRLAAPIASGGMASVHLARVEGQAGFSRLVAIKVLHRHLTQDRDFVAMFLDEARFAARVRHPNVVDVYDVETIDGELVIVMQYIEGAALSALLRETRKRKRVLPPGIGLRAVHEALRGLHAAHELSDEQGEPLGLVHRDVSPQNVLVGVDGVARVTDFGVAKARGRIVSTQGAAVKGKTRYLAPEQIRGEPLDRRVDVFAAGIVLWECLTARALFSGANEGETMMAVLQRPIEPPSQYAPNLPLELDRICLRALERDPARRFPTAAAFADAIEDAVGNGFAKTREVSDWVEELHAEELARLRAAASRSPNALAPEYGGSTPAAESSGVEATASATSAEVSGDPETRSALPITSGAHRLSRGRRRWGWLLALLGLTGVALAIGYVVGRAPANDADKLAPTAPPPVGERASEPARAGVSSIGALRDRAPAPSAVASASVSSSAIPSASAPPQLTQRFHAAPTKKKSIPAKSQPSKPFMPGAL